MKRKGECGRCGTCCRTVGLKVTVEEGNERGIDFLNFASLHQDVQVNGLGGGVFELLFRSPCRFLQEGPGGFSCAFYENRPDICKRFPEEANPNCPGFTFEEDEHESEG